jgi:hypothetical protein
MPLASEEVIGGGTRKRVAPALVPDCRRLRDRGLKLPVVPRGVARDPLVELPPDVRIAAQKARLWLIGVVWATVVGYGSAWMVSRFSGFGSAVLAIAITVQVGCFVLWWHYMNAMDRGVDKFVAAQGVSLDVPAGGGWTGFAKRHPILFGVALSVVLLSGIVLFAFNH